VLAAQVEGLPAAMIQVDEANVPRLALGIGVVDVKVNAIETPDDVARRIEAVEKVVGPGRVRYVHPDCGF
jgi:5-methyltetrahydropteroyltriglutamate--homocysteine methyltransferase